MGKFIFQVTGFRARRRAAVPGSRLAGRLMGLSQRSRVIAGNAARRARRQQQVILASPQVFLFLLFVTLILSLMSGMW